MFFERVDEELNKVNQFYRAKEAEFVERGEALSKQLQILTGLKQLIHERRRKSSSSNQSAGTISRSCSYSAHNSELSGNSFLMSFSFNRTARF